MKKSFFTHSKQRRKAFNLLLIAAFLMSFGSFGGLNVASAAALSTFSTTLVIPNSAAGTDNQTAATSTTQANVEVGTDNQTAATSTTQANVAEVKASRTLTVNATPADGETITIGSCVVTFVASSSVTDDETDCTDDAAQIDIDLGAGDVARVATETAAILRSLTNVDDPNHNSLAISGADDEAIFTTSGTETSATAVAFTDNTTGDISSSASTTGVVAVAQVSTVTPANVEIGDTFTAVINGTAINFTATVATVANVTAGLTAAINGSAENGNVTAVDQTTHVEITSDAAGTAFTLTSSTTNKPAVAQVSTVTPANVEIGDTFTAAINGTAINFTATVATVANVTAGLTAAINGSAENGNVTAVDQTTHVEITSDAAGTAFTLTSSTTNAVAVAQVVDFTPGNITLGETFHGILNGAQYDYKPSAGTVQAVVEGLQPSMNAAAGITCTENDAKITCTADSAGTGFTYDAAVSEAGSSGGGGGGGTPILTNNTPKKTAPPAQEAKQDEAVANQAEETTGEQAGEPQREKNGEVAWPQIISDGQAVVGGDVNRILGLMGAVRNLGEEEKNASGLVNKIISAGNPSDQVRNAIINFVTYGTPSAKDLGAGERAGVVNSFQSAFGRLPANADDWRDCMAIANGRWPNQLNSAAEEKSYDIFQKIYLRAPNRQNARDDAAVTVYHLRPAAGSAELEQRGSGDFDLQAYFQAYSFFRQRLGYGSRDRLFRRDPIA